MRNEFYGDRRDLWKWTVALREAGPGRKILHVAMLHSTPKRPRQMPRDIDERVWRFFTQEWECLDAESSRCSRIGQLSDGIRLISQPFDNKHRSEYFGCVVAALSSRSREERYVVLIDPDTGIAGSKPTSKHVCLRDLEMVWNAMLTDDVLLIYQHNAHVEKQRWIREKKKTLAELSGSLIKDYSHSDVCYFVLHK